MYLCETWVCHLVKLCCTGGQASVHDGIWAKYWYASVEQSTGFMPYQESDETLPAHLNTLLADCNALYAEMARYAPNL